MNVVPHSHSSTKDRRWVAIVCTCDKIFERLTKAMGEPELGGAGWWATIAQREAERATGDAHGAEWTGTMARDTIFENAHYAAWQNIAFVQDERIGSLAVPNVVPRLSGTPGSIDWLGPRLGKHNEEIYAGRLGLTSHELRDLAADGVI